MKEASHKSLHRLSALGLIEEAVHLLRQAPAGLFACYYLGAAPFVLGLLYFGADMSRGAYAHRHLAEASLGLALLFVWMKTWQSVYSNSILQRLRRPFESPDSAGRFQTAKIQFFPQRFEQFLQFSVLADEGVGKQNLIIVASGQ